VTLWQQMRPNEVREALERVTAREELRGLYEVKKPTETPDWVRWLERLFEGSDTDVSSVGLGWLPHVVAVLVLLFVAAAGIYFVLHLRRDDVEADPREELRSTRLAERLAAGRAARLAGDLPAALRAFWAALVTGLGQGAELVFRPAWTCREMLARSRAEGPDTQLLTELLPRVERLEFGKEEITLSDVELLERLCEVRLAVVLQLEGRRA